MSDKQIHALITLLGDHDERTAEAVTEKLLDLGDNARPALTIAASSDDPIVRLRAQSILRAFRVRGLTAEWGALVSETELEPDLERGAFLIAAQAYPELNIPSYQRRLDALADELRARLRGVRGDMEILQAVNQYLFIEVGFHGNTLNYYDAENSYLHCVIDRLTGIPISLSVVYLLVARRLNLPVHGVGTPGHFLLRYATPRIERYIDSFNGGAIMDREECALFLRNLGFGFEEAYLDRAFSKDILARMIRNLLVIYHQTNDIDHAANLEQFLNILSGPEGLP